MLFVNEIAEIVHGTVVIILQFIYYQEKKIIFQRINLMVLLIKTLEMHFCWFGNFLTKMLLLNIFLF